MASSKPAVFLGNLYLQIILPFELIYKIFIRRYDTINEYVLLAIYVLVIFFFLFSFCYWEYTNFYLRYIYYFLIIIGILLIIYRIMFTPNLAFGELSNLTNRSETFIWIIVFIIIDTSIILSKIKKKNCFSLAFPFKNGQFLVIDGGDGKKSYFSNYHYYGWKRENIKNYYSMRFATDIIKLNKYGFAKSKILSSSNEDYNIYGERVYSPVEGEVVEVILNEDDNIPYGKLPNKSGNQITIKNGNYYISLYHFKKDTIVVNLGQKLKVGDYLGEVGNSGYSSRPHFHIQVVYSEDNNYWLGKGIPIIFNNRYPVKNCLINA